MVCTGASAKDIEHTQVKRQVRQLPQGPIENQRLRKSIDDKQGPKDCDRFLASM